MLRCLQSLANQLLLLHHDHLLQSTCYYGAFIFNKEHFGISSFVLYREVVLLTVSIWDLARILGKCPL